MTDLFDSMPTELVKASEDICLWFAERNINKWALGGLQSREALQADGIGDAVQESHMQDEPSIDALIAEIDGLERIDFDEGGCDYPCSDGDNYRFDDVRAVLNKYRGVK